MQNPGSNILLMFSFRIVIIGALIIGWFHFWTIALLCLIDVCGAFFPFYYKYLTP